MVAALLARVLKIALHFTILSSVVDVDFQLHQGRTLDAFVHTAIVCVCIIMLAVTGYLATKLLSKNSDSIRFEISRTPTKKPLAELRSKKKPAGNLSSRKTKKPKNG